MTTIRIFCINITVVSMLIFVGCEDSTESKNEQPVISSLTADPDTIEVEGTSDLVCLATDPDGDNLIYNWEIAAGSISGIGSNVTWTAPSSVGTYSVSCTVDDGNGGQDIKSINIIVETPINIIAHWTFDEMTGNVLTDISGNNHHGIITDASWVNGYSGGGLHFINNSYITVSFSEELHPTSSITIEAIVKLDTFLLEGEGSALVLSTKEGGGYSLGNYNGDMDIYINIDSTYYGAQYFSEFVTQRWYHIAGTYDGSKLRFYADGILKDEVDISGTITYKYDNALQIGRDATEGDEPGGEGDQFNGVIDEIRISGEALEPDRFLEIPE